MRCTCRDHVPPVGARLNALMRTQIDNGTRARLALYHYDFLPGDARLNRHGRRQLRKIAQMMLGTTGPLRIQPTPGAAQLDDLRRKIVAAELAKFSTPIAAERVIVDSPLPYALDGIDAEIVHGKLLNLGSSGGSVQGGGSSSAGAGGVTGVSGR